MDFEIKGTKLVEIPYLEKELSEQKESDKVLIVLSRLNLTAERHS